MYYSIYIMYYIYITYTLPITYAEIRRRPQYILEGVYGRYRHSNLVFSYWCIDKRYTDAIYY